ncbi:hypothetical protein ACCS93_33460 [Rhizobium ruizarguesonis]
MSFSTFKVISFDIQGHKHGGCCKRPVGDTPVVKSREGKDVTINPTSGWPVTKVVKASVGNIRSADYVGMALLRQPGVHQNVGSGGVTRFANDPPGCISGTVT